MKTLHYLILFVFACILSILIMSPAHAQNDATLQYGSKPPIQKETPEQLHKKLVIARDAIGNIMGSKMGTIPFNEVGIDEINSTLDVGIDSEKATLSAEQYLKKIKEIVGDVPIKITFSHITSLPLILSNNSVRGNVISAPILSPLKQFKSGIAANNVKCEQGLQHVIRAEDGYPACVKPDTSKILIERGWASSIIVTPPTVQQTSGNATLPASFEPCDTPYPQSNGGIAVLYMPTNSIGKICVRYSNPNDSPEPIGITIFDANNMHNQNVTGITTWTDSTNNTIPKGDVTVVYWIKTSNQTGLYGLTFYCGDWNPFAVGYDGNSNMTRNNFPFIKETMPCPNEPYHYHIDSTTGMGVKHIS